MITYDTLGRMDRASIIEYVRRNLASLRPISVDPNTGVEQATPPPLVNAAFTTDEITIRINSSLTKAFLLMNAENRSIFLQTRYYDVLPNESRYPWPADMAQVVDMKWKVPGAPDRVDSYHAISRVEQSNPHDAQPAVGRPSWRWEAGFFILNQPPHDFISGLHLRGIWLTYVPWISPLTSDTDVLPMPYAPVLQEVIAYDVAVDLVRTKEFFVDITQLQGNLTYWMQQLGILVGNAYRPNNVQLVSKRPYVHASYAGR